MLKRPEEEKRKWLEGVKKELNDFNKRGVWKVKKIKDISEELLWVKLLELT